MCCDRHWVTQPLAKRVCQLPTIAHSTRLPQLLQDQHGVTLCHETIVTPGPGRGGKLARFRQLEAARCARHRENPPAAVMVPQIRIGFSCVGMMYYSNQRTDDPQHPGQKRPVWQQMKVGCVFSQDAQERWHKRMIWGRESPAGFAAALWRLACQCGNVQAKEKLLQAGGGSWCRDIRARIFSDATGVLGWYHASENVWESSQALAAETTPTGLRRP